MIASTTTILVLQKPEVLPAQREQIGRLLGEALGGVRILYASSPDALTDAQSVEVVICPTLDWLPLAVAKLPNLRWIHFLSAGVDAIWDMGFAKSGLRLSKSSGVHAAAMAEVAFALMLHFVKQIGVFQRQQAERTWRRYTLKELTGQTLGIVGLGSIGQELARRAKCFDMRVLGALHSQRPVVNVDQTFGPDGVETILQRSDFVVLTVPLTPATRRLVGERLLHAMKPSAYLVNLSRGGVVDERALVQALKGGRIAGAALDVFEHEPLSPASELWEMENVVVLPHVAGTTEQYMERALKIFIENFASLLQNGRLVTPVDLTRRY